MSLFSIPGPTSAAAFLEVLTQVIYLLAAFFWSTCFSTLLAAPASKTDLAVIWTEELLEKQRLWSLKMRTVFTVSSRQRGCLVGPEWVGRKDWCRGWSRKRVERAESGRVTKVDKVARGGKCLHCHPGPRLSMTDFAWGHPDQLLLFSQVGRLTDGYWSKWKKSILATNTGFPKSHLQSSCVELTVHFLIVQFSSIAQSRPTLCDPMDFSMPGFPVHH